MGETVPGRERFWVSAIAILSLGVVAAVAYLLLAPRSGPDTGVDVSGLPALNAILNGLSGLQLAIGYILIRRRRIIAHRRFMQGAFAASVLFLASYVTYHALSPGPRGYAGGVPGLYYAVLLSHIVLAATVVPLALLTLYRGWTDQRSRHRRIARIALPVWLYVSVTGVAVYGFLYW